MCWSVIRALLLSLSVLGDTCTEPTEVNANTQLTQTHKAHTQQIALTRTHKTHTKHTTNTTAHSTPYHTQSESHHLHFLLQLSHPVLTHAEGVNGGGDGDVVAHYDGLNGGLQLHNTACVSSCDVMWW